MNDGFCDLCTVFVGHEDISIGQTQDGVKFCACTDCREELSGLDKDEQKRRITAAISPSKEP